VHAGVWYTFAIALYASIFNVVDVESKGTEAPKQLLLGEYTLNLYSNEYPHFPFRRLRLFLIALSSLCFEQYLDMSHSWPRETVPLRLKQKQLACSFCRTRKLKVCSALRSIPYCKAQKIYSVMVLHRLALLALDMIEQTRAL
jgi:hypothetical protein